MQTRAVLLVAGAVTCSMTCFSQNVAINEDGSAPANSAILDIKSTSKGLLIPRLTTAQRTGIAAPDTGLLVYDTNTSGFWYFDGTLWIEIASGTIAGNTLDDAYDEGGAGAGRVITADGGAVSVQGSDGFEVTGTLGSGAAIGTLASGPRMFFNPAKAAFRAGMVTGTNWDDASVGNYSVAMGLNAMASGLNSAAIGFLSVASSGGSMAIGQQAQAPGGTAVALGHLATASGASSVSIGYNSLSPGLRSVAIGNQANASALHSIALAGTTVAGADYSLAGPGGTAEENYSFAMGSGTTASGNYSFAFGNGADATGTGAVAFGNGVVAAGNDEFAVGKYNTLYTPSGTDTDQAFVVGNGTSAAARSNALLLKKNGELTINDAYTLPNTDGSSGEFLVTDGAGNVDWGVPPAFAGPIAFASYLIPDVTIPDNIAIPYPMSANSFTLNCSFNTANSTFTVPVDGLYSFTVYDYSNGIPPTSASHGDLQHVFVEVDLTPVKHFLWRRAYGEQQVETFTFLLNLLAGQEVRFRAQGLRVLFGNNPPTLSRSSIEGHLVR